METEDGFKPVALSRYVIGDSAIVHARAYERELRQGIWVRFASGARFRYGLIHSGSDIWTPHSCYAQGGAVALPH